MRTVVEAVVLDDVRTETHEVALTQCQPRYTKAGRLHGSRMRIPANQRCVNALSPLHKFHAQNQEPQNSCGLTASSSGTKSRRP